MMKTTDKIKYIRKEIPVGVAEAKQLLDKFSKVEDAISYWKEKVERQERFERAKKYIDINELYEFSPEYCKDIKTEHKAKLKPLATNYCNQLWNEYVTEEHRHLMLIRDNEELKFKELRKCDFNWQDHWDSNNYDAFTNELAPIVDWNLKDTVYFFWGRYNGLETTWEVMCEYWIPFLYEEEKNIIINPQSELVVVLSVHGMVEIGKRIIKPNTCS